MSYAFSYDDSSLSNVNPYPFKTGDIINENEIAVIDILETVLGSRFRCCPQIPLSLICSQTQQNTWLPKPLWQFWINSRVDIAIIDQACGASRQAKLIIECQSNWHNDIKMQHNDALKAQLITAVNIPLIYVRRVATDQRFYRFYMPNSQQEIFYNTVTCAGSHELQAFLQPYCF